MKKNNQNKNEFSIEQLREIEKNKSLLTKGTKEMVTKILDECEEKKSIIPLLIMSIQFIEQLDKGRKMLPMDREMLKMDSMGLILNIREYYINKEQNDEKKENIS